MLSRIYRSCLEVVLNSARIFWYYACRTFITFIFELRIGGISPSKHVGNALVADKTAIYLPHLKIWLSSKCNMHCTIVFKYLLVVTDAKVVAQQIVIFIQ